MRSPGAEVRARHPGSTPGARTTRYSGVRRIFPCRNRGADRVFLQRDAGITALLRAVMHQAVFANVEIARAGPATPLIRPSQGDVVLEGIHAREAALLQLLHLMIDAPLFVAQGLQLSGAVMDDSHRRTESQFQRAPADRERVLRIAYATAHHGIN